MRREESQGSGSPRRERKCQEEVVGQQSATAFQALQDPWGINCGTYVIALKVLKAGLACAEGLGVFSPATASLSLSAATLHMRSLLRECSTTISTRR